MTWKKRNRFNFRDFCNRTQAGDMIYLKRTNFLSERALQLINRGALMPSEFRTKRPEATKMEAKSCLCWNDSGLLRVVTTGFVWGGVRGYDAWTFRFRNVSGWMNTFSWGWSDLEIGKSSTQSMIFIVLLVEQWTMYQKAFSTAAPTSGSAFRWIHLGSSQCWRCAQLLNLFLMTHIPWENIR